MNGSTFLLPWLVDLALASSAWLLAVLLVRAKTRQPARRMALARAAVVGLLALAVFAAIPDRPRLSWMPAEDRGSTRAASLSGPSPRPDPLRLEVNVPGPSAEPRTPPTSASRPLAARSSPPSPSTSHDTSPIGTLPRWPMIVTGLYLAGATLALGWLVLGAIQSARLVRSSHTPPAALEVRIRDRLADVGIRPQVRLSDRITHPLAVGLLRPTILLPSRFAEAEPPEHLRAVLRHESAHLRNGDLRLLAACRLALVLFYPHPLFWALRRSISIDQEILADAFAAEGDTTSYAEMLLRWATTGLAARPVVPTPALGIWERPSQLRRRIALLLDHDRTIESRPPRRWRVALRATSLLMVLALSLASVRPDGGPIAAPTGAAGEPTDGDAADTVTFRGRVLDPDGRPCGGAKLYLNFFSVRDYLNRVPPPLRATSDRDGRFRFSVEKAFFRRGSLEAPWRYTHVVARTEDMGFGLGFSDAEGSDDDRELTLRLVRDDAPIAGRLLDLEGRPIPGVTARVTHVYAPPGGDLTPYLAAARTSTGRLYEARSRHLGKELQTFSFFEPIAPATSGPDGRFVIRGVGRERLVIVELKGPTSRWVTISVLTRPGNPIDLVDLRRAKDPWVERYYGATFSLSMEPSRPYEGVVRDRDSGQPVPGATVEGHAPFDKALLSFTRVDTTSDAHGRFVLAGLPLGGKNEVIVTPPDDQPYLTARFSLPNSSVPENTPLDFGLKRGVWLSGRITDRSNGKPLLARVRYHAAAANPHLGEAPGFADLFTNGNQDLASRYSSGDGSYRIAVLPGVGLLSVWIVIEGSYRSGETASPKPIEAAFRPYPYDLGNAWSTLDVGDEPRTRTRDFALDRAPTRMIHGLVIDPEGRPVIGARYNGMSDIRFWSPIGRENRFTVADLRPRAPRSLSRLLSIRDRDELGSFLVPEDTRVVAIVHEGRRLAGSTRIGWSTPEPFRVTLRPWASVSARVVDRDGRPIANLGVEPRIVLKDRIRDDRIDHWNSRVFTDDTGNLRIEGFIPGLSYRLVFEDENGLETNRGIEVPPLQPGESRSLGDVKADVVR